MLLRSLRLPKSSELATSGPPRKRLKGSPQGGHVPPRTTRLGPNQIGAPSGRAARPLGLLRRSLTTVGARRSFFRLQALAARPLTRCEQHAPDTRCWPKPNGSSVMSQVTATVRERVQAQGFCGFDDETYRQLNYPLRLSPAICMLWAAIGTALASPTILWTLVPFAALGAILPGTPSTSSITTAYDIYSTLRGCRATRFAVASLV